MSFCLKTLLMFLLSFLVYAEEPVAPSPPPQPKPAEVQIYTKESGANVEALNKATEVLRDPVKAINPDHAEQNPAEKKPPLSDPTQMSPNFRQALKGKIGAGANPNPGNPAAVSKTPLIELAAKILGKDKSVMLKINDRVVQMAEKGKMAFVDKDSQQVITIRVDKIDKNQVKIFVEPLNETLILQ